MTRNLKALNLVFVAIFAMGALTASAASATDFFTTSNGESAYLTGTSHDNVLSIAGAGVSFDCTTSSFTGTVRNGFSTATVLPRYSGKTNETPHSTQCSSTLGSVTVDVNDCHYTLTGETLIEDQGKDAYVWIGCPGGKQIEITGPLGCTVRIPSQTPISGGVVYANLPNHTGGSAIKVTATVTGITYTATHICGLVGIEEHGNDAVYTGTVTATGYTDTSTNSTTELTSITEGSQIGISVS